MNVLTHHKCASSWISRYMDDYSRINGFSTFITEGSFVCPKSFCEINIILNSSYGFLRNNIDDGVHIIRNPLDIVVSAYYSHKETHPLDGWPKLSAQRKLLRESNIHDGMFATLAFLEKDDFYDGAVGPLHGLRHWDYDDTRFPTLRMEDIVLNPNEMLGSILKQNLKGSKIPHPEAHTFLAMTGRQSGQIDNSSHYRSGEPDQWRSALPEAVIAYIRTHYEQLLKRFYPTSL